MKIPSKKQNGFAMLLCVMIILSIGLLIGAGLCFLAYGSLADIKNITKSNQSYYGAEAGIEDGLYRIIKNKKYQATTNLTINETNVEINISSQDNSKTIESRADTNNRIRKLKTMLTIDTDIISFHYGAQADDGGIFMKSNAQIIGNVYSNGSIKGENNSLITGDAWVAGGLAASPDQQSTLQNSDFSFGLSSYLDTAQSFIPSQSSPLSKISLYLKKIGTPPDQTVRILSDNNGKPSTNSLASGTLISSLVGSQYSWIDITFSSPPNLSAGQTYWIMVDVSQNQNNYWIWGKDSTNSYALGAAQYDTDWSKKPNWANLSADLNFKTWHGGIDTYINGITTNIDGHAHIIKNSFIGRDAYYQIIENTTVNGIQYPNSVDPPVENLPISYAQIQDWEKAACCDTGNGCQPECIYFGDYSPLNGSSVGPKKIIGDFTMPHNGTVTITGPIWVTGTISASNNSIIKLQQDFTQSCPIIGDNPDDQFNDGKIRLSNNVITQDSLAGGYLAFISTTKPTLAFDPDSPDASDPAILLSNNVNVNNPQSIIFALNGVIKVENNAEFKEITGYSLYLDNNARVVYDYGLSNVNFSSGPGAGWVVESWEEIE